MNSKSAQDNMDIIRKWIDAHNRHGIGGTLDYVDENVEIFQFPTGVTYNGKDVMRRLMEGAAASRSIKEITNLFASEDDVCVEYTTRAKFSGNVDFHGFKIPPIAERIIETNVCFVCRIKNGKIYCAHEYLDQASVLRQFGIDIPGPSL